MLRRLPVRALVAASGLLACLGCDSTGPDSGNLYIRLTDSPFADAKAVLVTFSEVQVHRSGGGWESLEFADGGSTRACDLKKLQGAVDVLGVGNLPEGHYTQIRLVVSEAALYFDQAAAGEACASEIAAPTGATAELEISSGEVKLNREFDCPASGATTITLDFDGDKSIHETGSGRYRMSPVIAVVSVS